MIYQPSGTVSWILTPRGARELMTLDADLNLLIVGPFRTFHSRSLKRVI